MSKPDPPTPPNPYATAAAQTGTNVSTGVANAFLNNINQNTPEGSLSYDVTGNYNWTDPSTGSTYTIPRFTSTQTYSPAQQQLRNTQLGTQQNLANMGQQQSARVGGLLSTPFNANLNAQQYLQNNPDVLAAAKASGVDPMAFAAQHYQQFGQAEGRAGGSPTGGNAQNLANVPGAKTSYDAGWDITRSYGPEDNFGADRQRVEDAMMGRLNPQLQKERGNIEQRLADQGIRYGSQAYTSAMDDYNRQSTDARFAAIGQAGDEQARLNQMAQAQASFQNQAQAQQNAQNASQAGFYNAGQAQNLSQQQSIFNASNAQRNQWMQEQYQQRNQPLNEITSLMGGSQIQQPNWLNSPTSQIATTDFAGIMNANAQQQQNAYSTAMSGWNSTMGGLLGLGAGAIKASDRRVKKNIDKIGSVFAASPDGEREKLPIYEWEYKGTDQRRTGPMAQDVERIDPGAVREIGGVKHIDTGRVMGGILRAA